MHRHTGKYWGSHRSGDGGVLCLLAAAPFFQRGCQAWSSYVSHVRLHGEGLPRPPFPVEGSMIAYELHNSTHIPSPFMHEPIHITI